MDPLPVSRDGFIYILTVIDRSTRLVEAIPLYSIIADSCAATRVNILVSRFGVPTEISTDLGSPVIQSGMGAFLRHMSVRHMMTTAYHPQSNSSSAAEGGAQGQELCSSGLVGPPSMGLPRPTRGSERRQGNLIGSIGV
jgi:hypothetical protein